MSCSMRVSFIFVVWFLFTSCAAKPTLYKMHDLNVEKTDDFATIVPCNEKLGILMFGTRSSDIKIYMVDGVSVTRSTWDGTIRIELKPGEHTINSILRIDNVNGGDTIIGDAMILKSNFLGGHKYLLKPLMINRLTEWKPILFDMSTVKPELYQSLNLECGFDELISFKEK